MPKNRVLHTRITDDTHSKLTQKCSEIGCNMTDYVISVLEDSFEDEEPEIIEPSSKGIVQKISYDDGKSWIDVKPLQNVEIVND